MKEISIKFQKILIWTNKLPKDHQILHTWGLLYFSHKEAECCGFSGANNTATPIQQTTMPKINWRPSLSSMARVIDHMKNANSSFAIKDNYLVMRAW